MITQRSRVVGQRFDQSSSGGRPLLLRNARCCSTLFFDGPFYIFGRGWHRLDSDDFLAASLFLASSSYVMASSKRDSGEEERPVGGITRIQTIFSCCLVILGFFQLCYGLEQRDNREEERPVASVNRVEFPSFDAEFGNGDRSKGVELLG
ncbi:hypothetical protein CDAR_605531 [Caerostris darwini]|uniref:Uncharacterized protein n=1 Tax=Caerostris darwini TaxID=1538125 RepID=A0AAV4RF70_9ARAC|nr:hypothetical protein CDAR_605531 [Caerostris darwini]